MLSRRIVTALMFVAVPVLAHGQAPAGDAVALVKSLYFQNAAGWEKRPYSKRLGQLYTKAVKKSEKEHEALAGLDFDPLTGSQDADDKFQQTLVFTEKNTTPDKTVVEASMQVFRQSPRQTIIFELIREGKGWKIDDIVSPDPQHGWRWSKLLELALKGQ